MADARASRVGTAEGSAWSVSSETTEAIAEGKAWRVSMGIAVPSACAVCARFCASLIGWVMVLQASMKTSRTVSDRNLDRRDISVSFPGHNHTALYACLGGWD